MKRYYPRDDKPWLWALLFGPVYFLIKDARNVGRGELALLITSTTVFGEHWMVKVACFMVVWIAYSTFARELLRKARREEKRLLNGYDASAAPVHTGKRRDKPDGGMDSGSGASNF